jgi:hypothetical protein
MEYPTKHLSSSEVKSLLKRNFPEQYEEKLLAFAKFMYGQTVSVNEKDEVVYYKQDIDAFLNDLDPLD